MLTLATWREYWSFRLKLLWVKREKRNLEWKHLMKTKYSTSTCEDSSAYARVMASYTLSFLELSNLTYRSRWSIGYGKTEDISTKEFCSLMMANRYVTTKVKPEDGTLQLARTEEATLGWRLTSLVPLSPGKLVAFVPIPKSKTFFRCIWYEGYWWTKPRERLIYSDNNYNRVYISSSVPPDREKWDRSMRNFQYFEPTGKKCLGMDRNYWRKLSLSCVSAGPIDSLQKLASQFCITPYWQR